jgi:uncharacterized protein (TIGR02594 family)
MHTRRSVSGLALALAASGLPLSRALAIPDLAGPPKPLNLERDVPTIDEALAAEISNSGTMTPYQEEVVIGKKVLAGAPASQSGRPVTPLAVAQYFLDVGAGRVDPDWAGYVQEWPVRANPVILGFFDQTSYRRPAGDTTPWCAAFVNWCMHRAYDGRAGSDVLAGTRSAASQSFLRWPGSVRTDDPKPGDLCVFTNTGDPAHGHVAFLVGRSGNSLFILGGNQRYQSGYNNGEVNISRFNVNSLSQPLTAFVTAKGLRG